MHNGMTIVNLENLVSQVSARAERGQDMHETSAVSPAPILCACEADATKTFDGEPVCDECWDAKRYAEMGPTPFDEGGSWGQR